jgi:hypothetical protein
VKYHPWKFRFLTCTVESGIGTVSGGRFDWGGRLLKSNGGVRRSPRAGWKSAYECKGTRGPNCETDKSSRCESRS